MGTKLNKIPGQIQHHQIINPVPGVNFGYVLNGKPPIPTHYDPGKDNDDRPYITYGKFSANILNDQNNRELEKSAKRLAKKKRAFELKETSAAILNRLSQFAGSRKEKEWDNVAKKWKEKDKLNGEEGKYLYSLPWHCCKTPATCRGTDKMQINSIPYITNEFNHRHFANLQHCENHWVCPVCAGAAAKDRADEIYYGLESYISQGYKVNFVTLTMVHYANERLDDILKILLDGFDWAKNHRSTKARLSENLTYVRALEPTLGKNGWHPHIHCIFITRDDETDEYLNHFKRMWFEWLDRNNKFKTGSFDNSFNAKPYNGVLDTLSDYMCKWGIVQEISHTQQKVGRKDKEGYSPFEILGIIHDKLEWELKRDPVKAFMEYAVGFKGKSMVRFSNGFFKNIGIDIEELRKEIKEKKETPKAILFEINLTLWNKLMRKSLLSSIHTAYEEHGIYSIHVLLLANKINYLFVDGNKFIYDDPGQISVFNSS